MEKIKAPMISEAFRAIGTEVSVDIVLTENISTDQARAAIEKIKYIFQKNEKIFSRFRDDSELSSINNNIGKEIFVSKEMTEVLELCLKFNELSGGYFDPRVIGNLENIGYDKDFKTHDFNSEASKKITIKKIAGAFAEDIFLNHTMQSVLIKKRIDTTGIAKGYTVDEAAQFLIKDGFKNFIVDAGGDMYVGGFNDEGESWRIGIEGIADEKLMLRLENEGIATSGIDRKRWTVGEKKYHHLINPKDPENFSYDIKSVSVIEAKTVEADGRAKVLVLMGREKGLEFANKNNLKALFLDYKGNVYLSEAIKGYIL
jgi:thiamine biosynthesis lipoprotein